MRALPRSLHSAGCGHCDTSMELHPVHPLDCRVRCLWQRKCPANQVAHRAHIPPSAVTNGYTDVHQRGRRRRWRHQAHEVSGLGRSCQRFVVAAGCNRGFWVLVEAQRHTVTLHRTRSCLGVCVERHQQKSAKHDPGRLAGRSLCKSDVVVIVVMKVS